MGRRLSPALRNNPFSVYAAGDPTTNMELSGTDDMLGRRIRTDERMMTCLAGAVLPVEIVADVEAPQLAGRFLSPEIADFVARYPLLTPIVLGVVTAAAMYTVHNDAARTYEMIS